MCALVVYGTRRSTRICVLNFTSKPKLLYWFKKNKTGTIGKGRISRISFFNSFGTSIIFVKSIIKRVRLPECLKQQP